MKLHVGAGGNYLPGWVNVDILSNNHADVYCNALAIPYPPESFELIYACHVLEHFNRHLILAALTHWRNLLNTGGTLRLSVPDFAAVVNHYVVNQELSVLIGLLYGGQQSQFNEHHIIFDSNTLTKALAMVGFRQIRQWDWRTTEHKDFDDYSQAYLPHFEKRSGMQMSLNLEAIK
jgi:predicted SAM-dependent methyltransferase